MLTTLFLCGLSGIQLMAQFQISEISDFLRESADQADLVL
jgi:hypothetical protein